MYFIYVPIFCVTAGLGETMGGALVSLAVSFVMATPLLRGTIQRYGIRRVLLVSLCPTRHLLTDGEINARYQKRRR